MTDGKFTVQLAAIFGNLVEEASGLHYAAKDRALFGEKIAAQAQEAGFDSLLDYYYRLRYDDPTGVETRALIRALLVHETFFFRELPQLQQLADVFLAEAIAARGSARVWSAACATGEEPLTLAMLLDARGLLDRVEIVASDLSESAIESARSGRYNRRALREGHPAALAQRYLFTDASGGPYKAGPTGGGPTSGSDRGPTSGSDRGPTGGSLVVAPHIHRAVSFRTLNLLDAASVGELGRFDLVLCRNVLIYFRDSVISEVIERLTGALVPGGVLAVGVSESLLRFGSALVCEERGGAFFYRRAR